MAQMLRLHRVGDVDAAQDLGGEARQPGDAEVGGFGQRVADAEAAVVRDAENVAGPGLLGEIALARQEEHRVLHRHRLAGARILQLHAAAETPRAHPHKGDAVAMLRVDIGLHLEDKAGDLVFFRLYDARLRRLRAGRRRQLGNAAQQLAHPEIVQRAAEKHRGHVPLAVGVEVEFRAQPTRHLDLLAQLLQRLRGQPPRQLRVVETGAADRVHYAVMHAALEQQERVLEQIVGAEKIAAHADRPTRRRHIQRQSLLDLVKQVERVTALAVELVDKGDDRHVAQPAHLEQLLGLLLDAARRVEHHDGAVDRGQRAIGVLAEILVAGRVEQIEDAAIMLEGHHRRADRDAALALDRHPVRAGAPALAAGLDLAGQLDRAAEQQQLFGQRRLAGIRVRDDRKGAPARDLVGETGHFSL